MVVTRWALPLSIKMSKMLVRKNGVILTEIIEMVQKWIARSAAWAFHKEKQLFLLQAGGKRGEMSPTPITTQK